MNFSRSGSQVKPMKTKILISLLFSIPILAHAERGHIADDALVYVHNGPSNQYRITTRIKSGTPVTILKRDPQTKYAQIRMDRGRTGWVEPTAIAPGDSMSVRLPKLQTSLEKSQATVTEQAAQIKALKRESTNLKRANQTLTSETDQLKATIKDLNFQIDSSDETNLMRWFTYGGLVALGGTILGLLLPYMPKRRKRRDEWF